MSINDGLELWSKQSKPTQSILQLILKSFKSAPNKTTRSEIIDILLETSSKYPKKFDWILAYFSGLHTELMLKKLLALELKEFRKSPLLLSPQSSKQNQPFTRINVISFFAKSYPNITCEQIVALLTTTPNNNSNDDNNIINNSSRITLFVLKLAAQSPALLNILLEQVLDSKSPYHHALVRSLESLVEHDQDDVPTHRIELFACLRQIQNSIGVFEIILNVLHVLTLRNRPSNSFCKKLCHYSVIIIQVLIRF